MRFADDLLQRYLRHFNDNESDSLDFFVQSILEQMDQKDLLEVFKACPKNELNEMLGNYLSSLMLEKLKEDNAATQDSDYYYKRVQ
ncbi:DUF6154 family protein [Aquibacillus rhizosphaerae]|uniref:DUF6154 family protein n=1 Tax=Aquibacillus rhizosphaerae TaxID=3051431 RepID=A0ABT7L9M1_9BACI|nr:DUF6154 family protein [Aquibacillus sp. LR5S19]MDL4842565.1 DUF6154 family protein [Aquibacillus sp. LR5S19]